MTKDGIVLATISSKDDLANLRELTNTKTDTVYKFKPSKRRFRKFIKENGFHSEEHLIRI